MTRPAREVLDAILDEALVAHVATVAGGEPVVLPFVCARLDDELVLHGSVRTGALSSIVTGTRLCVAVTLLDGLVVARSAFHTAMNYRAAVIHGTARVIGDLDERARLLAAITDRILPGRSRAVRPMLPGEIAATAVVAVALEHYTVKRREGAPEEPVADHDPSVWGGVIPLRLQALPSVPDEITASATPLPATRWDEEGLSTACAPAKASGFS